MGVTNHLPTRMIIFRPCLNGNPPFLMIRLGWHFLVLPKWDDPPSSLGNVMRPHWLDLCVFFLSGEQTHKEREQIPKHVTILLWDGISNPFKKEPLAQHAFRAPTAPGGGKCRPWRSDERVVFPLKNSQNHRVARTSQEFLAPKSSQSHCAKTVRNKNLLDLC